MFRRLAFAAVLAASTACAGLIHDFRFQSTLSDSLSAASLTPLGGTVGVTTYDFDAEEGLSLSNPALANSGTYTIAMLFSFADVTGYNRILDFKNLSDDSGLYVLDSNLNFFPVTTGAGDPIAAISFNDGTFLGVFDGPSSIAHFFVDDTVVPGEASAGSVKRIMIWDNALSASEVASLQLSNETGSTVPEPPSILLTPAGAAGLATFQRPRRR